MSDRDVFDSCSETAQELNLLANVNDLVCELSRDKSPHIRSGKVRVTKPKLDVCGRMLGRVRHGRQYRYSVMQIEPLRSRLCDRDLKTGMLCEELRRRDLR